MMKIIKPYFEIETPLDGDHILAHLERAGRTCYKSEDHITPESAKKFIKMIIERGHETILEHFTVTVRVICDRGVSHELVRHRIASYSQESTRYCNYSKDKFGNELTFIEPCFWNNEKLEHEVGFFRNKKNLWGVTMLKIEEAYFLLLENGATPQEARSILPNSLKTEIVMTLNLRSWRNFFQLRTPQAAHPQMREIAIPMLKAFQENIPVVFDDIEVE